MRTLIIAIAYYEPAWKKTQDSLIQLDNRVILVDREGIGSMAGAYNFAFKEHAKGYEYVWFVSNITFDPSMAQKLEQAMDDTQFAAIHPAMPNSDHVHMRPDRSGQVKEVPFIEFTSPIVRTNIFRKFPLDELMPYVGFDMDFGYRVRQHGHRIGVHHGLKIGHVYLRHSPDHPITAERLANRRASDQMTIARLVEKYGADYKVKIKYLNKLES